MRAGSRHHLEQELIDQALRDLGGVVDREVVEALHRTHIGDDQDPIHILQHAVRTAIGDGWGGSLLATDISDILFGTPVPLRTVVNLGALSEDHVNIVIHGHEPQVPEAMAIVAHPDDIEFGCAGTLARWVRAGAEVCYVLCTSGDVGIDQADVTRKQATAIREAEQRAAAEAPGMPPAAQTPRAWGPSPGKFITK